MKHRLLALAISLAILTAVAVNQNAAAQADARSQERIPREVRHELLMLPGSEFSTTSPSRSMEAL